MFVRRCVNYLRQDLRLIAFVQDDLLHRIFELVAILQSEYINVFRFRMAAWNGVKIQGHGALRIGHSMELTAPEMRIPLQSEGKPAQLQP